MTKTEHDEFYCEFCFTCKHLNREVNATTMNCPAYPDEIPSGIWTGKIKHLEKLSDQVGDTVFEAREDEDHGKFI